MIVLRFSVQKEKTLSSSLMTSVMSLQEEDMLGHANVKCNVC